MYEKAEVAPESSRAMGVYLETTRPSQGFVERETEKK